ncbi:MAG: hypothetical protein H0W17_01275 [Chloroflexi bacterium]|nr:hypothetical protein [Chloroflexota bacterium]
MRVRLLGLLAVGVTVVACSTGPSQSEAAGGACADDLPARTSPTSYPVAVLNVAGDDLPPVVGEVEWLGDDEPVSTSAPRAVHLERFTVLQVREVTELSLRMTDDVSISGWQVDALPADTFRTGDSATFSEWTSGEASTDLICVPIVDGEWVVRADLTFADSGGSGTYYWRINVGEMPGG